MRVVLITGEARGIGHAVSTDMALNHAISITWQKTAPNPLAPMPSARD
ncbi:MAG: hypothetical protein AAGH17_01385 [Pseudomonadota bacterium]